MEKLLIADSSTVFTELLTKSLQHQYEVCVCTTGDEAFRLLETFRPDVLIINLRLCYLDGLQVLRSSTYKPPVILALATDLSPYTLQSAQNENVDFVILLPCTVASVVDHVREITRLSGEKDKVRTPRQITEALLLSLGLPAKRTGFKQLKVGIPLFAQDENQLLNKELYPAIAELWGSNCKSVERSIRQVIEQGWREGDRTVWMKYFPGITEHPTNKKFITVLAQILRNSDPDRIW